jgi:hypothetical protein
MTQAHEMIRVLTGEIFTKDGLLISTKTCKQTVEYAIEAYRYQDKAYQCMLDWTKNTHRLNRTIQAEGPYAEKVVN